MKTELIEKKTFLTPLQLGFQPNTAVRRHLSNCITPLPIALESCSNPQKTQQVFESAMTENCCDLGFWIFCE